ncbi:MAG: penicillin acylase family protein [Methylocystis sp.]|uniref:penicillin acylase family protein n=1 Tax=Methylocystis sp. TaxID=1911079 RepID=UPI0039302DCE
MMLPDRSGTHILSSLGSPVSVKFDNFGVPHIVARDRNDAFVALGYVTGRDRLFQLDLLRRKSAGRLSEIFGAALINDDRWARTMGFPRLAQLVFSRLPQEHRNAVSAYAEGVNHAMRDAWAPPWEFIVLGYRPEPWTVEDCILVAFNLAGLSYTEGQERMTTAMRASLPEDVFRFLTPDSDCFNEMLAASGDAVRCASKAPVDSLAGLVSDFSPRPNGLTMSRAVAKGSNAWVIAPAKTKSGRAIIANDMHLSLSVPNIWYQADLAFGENRLEGVTLPGLPMVVAGSNGRVAWGMTSVDGDFADLIRLHKTGPTGDKYLSPSGALPFSSRIETIAVRGGADVVLTVKETIWGPVLSDALLGDEVAVRWTMLDPDATNLNLIDMERVRSVSDALPVLRGAGVPPLNGLLADNKGAIAWTLMGKIPKRRGFDGLYAEYWGDGAVGWDGYLSSEEMPSIVNPPQGFLVSANHRMISADQFHHKLSQDFPGGFRASRIHGLIAASDKIDLMDAAAFQLDSSGEFYRFYQQLALDALRGSAGARSAKVDQIVTALESWDERAEPSSLGLPLIVSFRSKLIEEVLAPILEKCRRQDSNFKFEWANVDLPLQAIIKSGDTRLAPKHQANGGWRDYLLGVVIESADELERSYARPIDQLSWGEINRANIAHPLSGALPLAAHILNLPADPLGGCPQCVRLYAVESSASVGANMRMALSPGQESEGLIQMAGGQSGQFGSPHYADREDDWVSGRFEPFRATDMQTELTLLPAAVP